MVSRFEKIVIEGLFGSKEPVQIDFDKRDPVRILYGLNASGKTTVMKIIQHSYCWNPLELLKLPFKSITYSLNKRGGYSAESYLEGYESTGTNDSKSRPVFDESESDQDNLQQDLDELNQILDDIELTEEQMKKSHDLLNGRDFPTNLDRESVKTDYFNTQYQQKNLRQKVPDFEFRTNFWLNRISQQLNLPISTTREDDLGEYQFSDYTWGDNVEIFEDKGDIDLRISGQFDHSIKLKVEKIEQEPEKIYFSQFQEFRTQKVGKYFRITQTSEPIIEFENTVIKSLFDTWSRIISLRSLHRLEGWYGWKFQKLYFGEEEEELLRMPDLYDLWESDWEKIESRLTDYSISRNYSGDGSLKPDIENYIKIIHNNTQQVIDANEFLTHHISADLNIHAKKGMREIKTGSTRVRNGGHRNYSPIMKTPNLISSFFDYRKTKLVEFEWGDDRTKFYILPPKILNISTERKNDDVYYHKFCKDFKRTINGHKDTIERMKSRISAKMSAMHLPFARGGGSSRKDIIDVLKRGFEIDYQKFFQFGDWNKKYGFLSRFIENAPVSSELDLTRYAQENNLWENEAEGTDIITLHEISECFYSIVKQQELDNLNQYLNDNFENISFDIENGILIQNEQQLRFSQLSSGIRQKFRIFTSVAMQVISAAKSLILIDEPEISLHLSWQRMFVDDITSFLSYLVSDARVQFDEDEDLESVISIIISTHSPAILGNHSHRGQKIGVSDFGQQ